jgi:hypothetical protein
MVRCFVVQQVWFGPAFDELCMLSPNRGHLFFLPFFSFLAFQNHVGYGRVFGLEAGAY